MSTLYAVARISASRATASCRRADATGNQPHPWAGKAVYNYEPLQYKQEDLPRVSVFAKVDRGAVFHTYSAFARGIDALNVAYQYLDLVPSGRDEAKGQAMSWLRRRDEYDR